MDTRDSAAPQGTTRQRGGWTRRRFLLVLSLGTGATASLLAACGGAATATVASTTLRPASSSASSASTASGAPTASTSTTSAASSAATVAAAAQSAGAKVTLQMSSSSHGAGNTFADVMKQVSQSFEKNNPSVTIETQFITANYHEKLTVAAAGGTAPDVIFFGAGKDMPSYMNQGFFLALDPYVQRSSTTKAADFFPVDWQFVQWKGKQYGIPWGSGVAVIFYNKALFDKAGVAYPPTDWNNSAWTWDAFLQTATKLTSGSGATKTFGYAPNTWWVYTQPWIWSNGGVGVLDAQATKCLLDQAPVSDAIQWIADLYGKLHVAPLPSEMSQGLQNMLTGNRVAMWEANTGQVPYVSTYKDFQWDIAPYPRGKADPHPRNPVDSITVWSKTKYPEQAWSVLEYATGTEGMKQLISAGEDIPARVSVAESDAFLRPNTPQHWKIFLDGVKVAREDPLTVIFPWMDRTIGQEYDSNVLTGKEMALQMAQSLVPQINAKLASG